MKSLFTTIVTVLLTLSLGTLQAQPQEYLTILHLNDTHSNLVAGSPRSSAGDGLVGGAARAATIVKSCYGDEYAPVLLHAGDAFIGDPMFNIPALGTQQSPDLEALAAMGCDAMALGNHEFDAGPDLLTGVLATTFGLVPDYVNDTDIPMLSANIDIPASYPMGAVLDAHVHPYTIIDRGPFKIGVIGLTTPSTNVTSMPAPVSFLGLDEAEIALLMYNVGGIAQDLVTNQGCNYVVLLSHMGMELDKIIATNVPYINLIVGGHDHIATKKPLHVHNAMTNQKVGIVQTEGFYRQIGKITLRLHNGMIDVQHYSLIDLDQSVAEDQDMLTYLINPTIGSIEAIPGMGGLFTAAVTSCSGTFTELAPRLTQPGMKDTHVGNFVADAFLAMTSADIAVEPGGSTSQALYAGPVHPVDIFRMIGYGLNTTNGLGFGVITLDVTGYNLCVALEKTLANIDVDDEYLLQVSGNMQYFYDPTAAEGQRLKGVLIDGSPIDPYATYTVATNALVPMFLDLLEVPYDAADPLVPVFDSEFELVMAYIMSNGITSLPCGPKPGRIVALPANTLPAPFVNNPMAKITQNSPNPFVGETAVQFEVAENTPVTVKVYDVIGREVAILHDGYASAGVHTAVFDAAGLPSGLYFCRLLTAGGTVQTMKMIKTR